MKFYTIPVVGAESIERSLNEFLRAHKITSVSRHWVESGPSSFWSVCIEYADQAASVSEFPPSRPNASRDKMDYKEILSPADFVVYARLRDLRKSIAEAETVPPYAIFNNEQLAKMVQNRVSTKTAMATIPGVASGRIDKYGERFLAILASTWTTANEPEKPAA